MNKNTKFTNPMKVITGPNTRWSYANVWEPKSIKELIKYFCQPCLPTKANGQRTRNRPFHAPDKWELFKRYNARDVEAEMGIQQKLSKFPVPPQVW